MHVRLKRLPIAAQRFKVAVKAKLKRQTRAATRIQEEMQATSATTALLYPLALSDDAADRVSGQITVMKSDVACLRPGNVRGCGFVLRVFLFCRRVQRHHQSHFVPSPFWLPCSTSTTRSSTFTCASWPSETPRATQCGGACTFSTPSSGPSSRTAFHLCAALLAFGGVGGSSSLPLTLCVRTGVAVD